MAGPTFIWLILWESWGTIFVQSKPINTSARKSTSEINCLAKVVAPCCRIAGVTRGARVTRTLGAFLAGIHFRRLRVVPVDATREFAIAAKIDLGARLCVLAVGDALGPRMPNRRAVTSVLDAI